MSNRIILNNVSYHGKGAIKEIPAIAKTKGFAHVFVCSDPDLIQFGVTAKVTDLLDEAGIAYTIYSGIKPNPTIENVRDGVEAFKACGADSIITIGAHYDTPHGVACAMMLPLVMEYNQDCTGEKYRARGSHNRGSHHRRHRCRGHDQLRHHRRGKGAQVCLR